MTCNQFSLMSSSNHPSTFSSGDYCEVNHCHNGGTCVTGVGDEPFICICADGFAGDTCNLTETGKARLSLECPLISSQTDLSLLSLSPLAPSPGPCNPSPCRNDGSCEVISSSRRGDVFSEYVCKCQPGFEGAHCQISKYQPQVIHFTPDDAPVLSPAL